MSAHASDNAFIVTEPPLPVPEAAANVDLGDAVAGLYVRCAQLELAVERERRASHGAQRDILRSILEIADALDRILARPSPTTDFADALARQRRSLEVTRRLLATKIARFNVASHSLKGMEADPALVDIEEVQVRDDLPEETVTEELVIAYMWNAEVLRRGQVVVAHNSLGNKSQVAK